MPTQGPLSPSAASDNSLLGTIAWANASNVYASDDSKATAVLTVTDLISHCLVATGFGFTLPTNAVVSGILVAVERVSAVGDVTDAAVRIVKGGSIGSTDRSSVALWPGSDDYASYGSSTDLWGESWTSAQVNAADFGVAVSGKTAALGGVISIDHIRITVTFTIPPIVGVRSEHRLMGLP